MINWKDNKLTPELESKLVQGSKVCFKWHGSSLLYTGRIEVDSHGCLYFVNEHNYRDDVLIYESMRFYSRLEGFFHFTQFEILP